MIILQSTEQHPPVTIHYDPLIATASFNSSSTVGGVILSDTRGARLAIESDIHIADFPVFNSCLMKYTMVSRFLLKILMHGGQT